MNCSLNCNCSWINETEWSPCVNGGQYLDRECTCDIVNVTVDQSANSSQFSNQSSTQFPWYYSQNCNGFTRIAQSCLSNGNNGTFSLASSSEDIATNNQATTVNPNQSNLLFLVFIPAAILVIAVIVGALIFIKKRQNEVSNA